MMTDAIAEIRRFEEARADALIKADRDALAVLLSDDLVHVHASGLVEDKRQYLDSATKKLKFFKVNRVSFHIRCYEGFAVATGELNQTIRGNESEAIVEMRLATTQTWIRQEDRWLQNTFHATYIGPNGVKPVVV